MFSGAETAIGFISLESIEKLAETSVSGARTLHRIAQNRKRLNILFLCGKVMSITASILFLYDFFKSLNSIFLWGMNFPFLITFMVFVIIFVIMENVLPLMFSGIGHEKHVSLFSYFLAFFYILLLPITFTLEKIFSLFIKRPVELAAKEEALKEFIQSETEYGVIEEEEKEMIESVLEFHDTTVREVMIPRIDVVAVEKKITIDELISIFEKEGHSRIPVYDERIDNILGVIYAKDLLPVISKNPKEITSITEIMRKAYYVPESKSISVLLKEFKKSKVHIAIVVDEYGGTAGIVALEDLLEEIVGEIQDEYDEDERDITWIDKKTLIIDAGIDVDSVNDIINAEIPADDYDTFAGFLYHKLGEIPKGGEEIKWESFIFKITETNGNRISKVMIKSDEPLSRE